MTKECKNCGEPLIIFYAVNYKELGCMSCGETYPMFCGLNSLEETEEIKRKIYEAEVIKLKIYDTLKVDKQKMYIGISEEEFKKRLTSQKKEKAQ